VDSATLLNAPGSVPHLQRDVVVGVERPGDRPPDHLVDFEWLQPATGRLDGNVLPEQGMPGRQISRSD
jgi:hypothetical protein